MGESQAATLATPGDMVQEEGRAGRGGGAESHTAQLAGRAGSRGGSEGPRAPPGLPPSRRRSRGSLQRQRTRARGQQRQHAGAAADVERVDLAVRRLATRHRPLDGALVRLPSGRGGGRESRDRGGRRETPGGPALHCGRASNRHAALRSAVPAVPAAPVAPAAAAAVPVGSPTWQRASSASMAKWACGNEASGLARCRKSEDSTSKRRRTCMRDGAH